MCLAATQSGRGQSPRSRSRFLLPSSFRSLSLLHPLHQPTSSAPACQPPRIGRAIFSSYLLPSCLASPFLLHKITEAEERTRWPRGEAPSLPTQLADPAVACGHPARRTLAPSSNRVAAVFFGSNGILSVASEAIGKQRPKMRFPVSSPSLTDKRTKGSRTLCCVVREPLTAPRRAVTSSPLRGYEQFPFFSSSSNFWERRQRMMERWRCLPLFLPSLFPAQQSTLRASPCARLPAFPARPLLHHHPAPDAADPCRLGP